jgi:hypothetical protein
VCACVCACVCARALVVGLFFSGCGVGGLQAGQYLEGRSAGS